MILVIDNFDSFTFNLVHQLMGRGAAVEVKRNNEFSPGALGALAPSGVVISPGPGHPSQAGCSVELVGECARLGIPLLGVCLGHQAIAVAFGAQVARYPEPIHGIPTAIHHDGRTLFRHLSNPFAATRYHSLHVVRHSLPDGLEVSAWSDDGLVMGVRHTAYPIEGIQFHPESHLTAEGDRLIAGWIAMQQIS